METQALDDLTPDDLTPDDDVAAHRAKAKTELDQIAGQARQALTEQGLGDISLFIFDSEQRRQHLGVRHPWRS